MNFEEILATKDVRDKLSIYVAARKALNSLWHDVSVAVCTQIEKQVEEKGIHVGDKVTGFTIRGREYTGIYKGVKVSDFAYEDTSYGDFVILVQYKNGNEQLINFPFKVLDSLCLAK